MKEYSGIAFTDDGRFVMASVKRVNGVPPSVRFSSWPTHQWYRTMLLFRRGVSCGIPVHWRAAESDLDAGSRAVFGSGVDGVQVPVGQHTDLQLCRSFLDNNLVSVVPEDSFLATIPLTFGHPDQQSFITITADANSFLIGVCIDRVVHGSFRMAPSSMDSLEGHLGRIQRYFAQKNPSIRFPRKVYLLGSNRTPHIDGYEIEALEVPSAADSISLRALGVACVPHSGVVLPTFMGESEPARFRTGRTVLYTLSVGMVVVSLLVSLLINGLNRSAGTQLTEVKSEYEEVLSGNDEIQALLARNRDLSEKILRVEKTLTRQTTWTKLLSALSEGRPDGLYVEVVGTNSGSELGSSAQVAFAGWAEKERAITELITYLQRMPFLSNIDLKVIEQDKKHRDLFRFRLECTLKLADG